MITNINNTCHTVNTNQPDNNKNVFIISGNNNQAETVISSNNLGYVPYFPDYSIQVFTNCVHVSAQCQSKYRPKPPLRERNDIQEFSKNSRLRLMDLLSRVNVYSYNSPVFFTCTFHEEYPTDSRELKEL